MIRTTPLAFDYPLDITQRATFRLPRDFGSVHEHVANDSPAFHYERDVEGRGRQVVLTYRLIARKDAVAVNDVPKHLVALNEISDNLDWIVAPKTTLASAASGSNWIFGVLLAMVALTTGAIGRLTASRGRTSDASRPEVPPAAAD
jgi:hypothetical protein